MDFDKTKLGGAKTELQGSVYATAAESGANNMTQFLEQQRQMFEEFRNTVLYTAGQSGGGNFRNNKVQKPFDKNGATIDLSSLQAALTSMKKACC